MNYGTLQGTLTTESYNLLNSKKVRNADQHITVLYIRLSNDDNDRDESNSVTNQKAMLSNFAKDHKLENTQFFVDDGYTGTNFKRPAFNQALELVQSGAVKNFVVKDMSRFGRSHIEVGMFTDILFPKLDIRFIAIGEGVDSDTKNDTGFDIIPFINIMNEHYALDTSKKIRAVFKQKGLSGKHLSTIAPYGYMKDPENKDNWLIDEESAKVVKKIFNYCKSGLGISRIARKLYEEKIFTPTEYWTKQGRKTNAKLPLVSCKWEASTIRNILEKKEYLGHTVNFKTYTKSYKDRRQMRNDESNYAVFENTHEAIVDQETFDVVQQLRKQRQRNTKSGKAGLFSGLVFCADCGHRHYFCTGKSVSLNQERYVCSGYQSQRIDCNNAHYIRQISLENIVLTALNQMINLVGSFESEVITTLENKQQNDQVKEVKEQEKKLIQSERRITELDAIIKRLYEDNVYGKLSDERFILLSKDYEEEQQTLKAFIEGTEKLLQEQQSQKQNIKKFIKTVKQFTELDKLDLLTVNSLIQRIEVHKPMKTSDGRTQQVDIYYHFVGLLNEMDFNK